MRPGRAQGDRGLALPIVALVMATLILSVSFAVDLGRQRADRRLAQSGADAVALDMVRIVEGRTLNQVLTDPNTATALSESAERNEFSNNYGFVVDAHLPRITNVEWGQLEENQDGTSFLELIPTAGIDTDRDGTDDLDEVPNAVRITAERTTDYFFQPGEGDVTRLATATADKTASFRLGSRLASVDTEDAALLDNFIGRALGGIDVSAVDYQGLVNANVEIGRLTAALGAAGPDELAGTTIDGPRFFDATADALEADGDTINAQTFRDIGAALDSNTEIAWDQIFALSQGGDGGAAAGSVNAFSLLQASAYAINGTNTIDVPSVALAGGLLGLAEVKHLTVTERPIVVAGREGVNGNTRQAQMQLVYTVNDRVLSGLLRLTGTITVSVELAGATGELDSIDCGRPGINLLMTPHPVTKKVSMDLTVRSLGIPIVGTKPAPDNVTANVTTTGASNGASFLFPNEFLPDIGTGTMVATPSTNLGLAGASTINTGKLRVLGTLPLGVTLNSVATLLEGAVDPLLNAIDNRVMTRLDRQLGLNVGGADMGAINMTCRSVKLVG